MLREYCVATLQEATVPILQARRDILAMATVSLRFTRSAATAVDISWTRSSHARIDFTLPIEKSEPRVALGYLPDELRWVPEHWRTGVISRSSPQTDYRGNHTLTLTVGRGVLEDLYWISSEDSVVPLTSAIFRTVPKQITDWQGRVQRTEHEERRIDLTALPLPLLPFLEGALKNKSINLHTTNDDPFLDNIASMIVKNTMPLADTGLEKATHNLSRSEIQKEIGAEWTQFIDSPWTKNHIGVLAKLKYVCETRETPRFHSLDLKGHYGFRLRTRDHTWIVGEVFRVTREPADVTDCVAQTEINNDGRGAVRFRNLVVRIESEER